MYYGLTSLGVLHTIISIVALFVGIYLMVRDHKITSEGLLGKTYVVTTILVCLTGFGIFQHGGFGKAHALGVITLLTFGLIYLAHRKQLGKSSAVIELVAFTFTLFFHFVPTITEGLTRLPYGSPFALTPDDQSIKGLIGGFLVVFIVIAILQVRAFRKRIAGVHA